MDVSVIIVTYNTCQLTKQCIDSIFKYTKDITFEVIVFDNASSDETRGVLSKDSRIKYVYSDENLGFGRANNEAYRLSKGRYVFLLNSDTYLLNNAIKIFSDTMSLADKNIACMGAMLTNQSGEGVFSFGNFLSFKFFFVENILDKIFGRRVVLPDNGIVPVVVGADLFIRRDIIEQYGFFDPRFFMYHEENDLQRRYKNAGFHSKIISGPQIVHLVGKSSSVGNFLSIKGGFVYMKKWYPHSYILFRVLFAITRLYKLFLPKLTMKERCKLLRVLFVE